MPTDLWRFAETLYQRPGIEAACLHLQAQGADVCLLLCATWLETQRISCTAERAEALRNVAHAWRQQVVVPLRQLRQSWREAAQGDIALAQLREQVKQLELAAEREQLQRLAACAESWPSGETQAPSNWLESLAGDAADRAALQTLRNAAMHVTD